jgi:hypothetical protein
VAKDDGDPNVLSESPPTTVIINIINRNDEPIISPQTFTANENINVAETVGTIVASDPDKDALTFLSTSESGCPFEVGSDDGRIVVTRVVDYESRRDWTLKVTVSDPRYTFLSSSLSLFFF